MNLFCDNEKVLEINVYARHNHRQSPSLPAITYCLF